ncbi:hypothetical protein MRX96_019148 [Rhipicephalus microplus]
MIVVSNCHVTMMNTRRVSESSSINSVPPEAYALHLSEKMIYTVGFQDEVRGHTAKSGGSLKIQSTITAPDDMAKAPHLEVQEYRTAGLTDACR